jgi:hypothetical protein
MVSRVVQGQAGKREFKLRHYPLPKCYLGHGVCHAVAVTKCRLQFLYTLTNLSHATTCLSVFAFDSLRAISHGG